MIVLRTFSKGYSLAGLRLGYLIARPEIVAGLIKVKDSYNCDTLSLVGGVAALADQAYLAETRGRILATRHRLTAALRALGYQVPDSQANFVWCTGGPPALEVYQALKERRDPRPPDALPRPPRRPPDHRRHRRRDRPAPGRPPVPGFPSERSFVRWRARGDSYPTVRVRGIESSTSTVAERAAEIVRKTRETDIRLSLDLDGRGEAEVATGVGFLDHMLELFARHSLMDLTVACTGDLHVDAHHTTEDVGICLGQAIDRALGDRAGIRRYGHAVLPMDETLVTCAVDLGGRPFWVWNVAMPAAKIGTFDSELVADFWQAVSTHGRMNLHVLLHYGRNTHHISEAIFKGLARALRMAFELDPRSAGVPSTKGTL